MGAGEQMNKIQFDYFQGMEAEQYSFYRVPKILFTEEYFKTLTCEAKVLYGLMLDRMSLSVKNHWNDKEGKVYIIFTVEEIAELMNCGTQKAVRLIKELDVKEGIGLIEKKRLGLGKPNVIYVKNFMTEKKIVGQVDENRIIHMNLTDDNGEDMPEYIQESEEIEDTYVNIQKTEEQKEDFTVLQNGENHNSRIVKITNQEFPKSSFSNGEDDKLGDVSIPDLEILTLYRPNKEDCSSKIQVVAGKQGAESQNQNSENHNSRIMKITNQDFSKSQIKNCENHNSGIVKIINQEFRFSKSNNTEFNNTDGNETELINPNPIDPQSIHPPKTTDEMDKMEQYRAIIRKNISYESFLDNPYYEQKEVDELVELMSDVMMLPDSSVLRIGGVERSVSVVKSRFMKLHYSHMEYVMLCLKRNTSKVENIRAYLLTTLYNATMTMENFYRSEVHHDQHRSG